MGSDLLLKSFLTIYFYTLEKNLNSTDNGLEKIEFQSDEANTDKPTKEYFKDYILENNDISSTTLKALSLTIDSKETKVLIEKLKTFKITSVFLPEELSDEQKNDIAKSKDSDYSNPDLYLEINDGKNYYFESLELKSTLNNKIPGSSVQQISPFEWVIFLKRNKDNVIVSTGYYLNSITEKLPFPDRSPRPQIGFKTICDWNEKHRKVTNDILVIENTDKSDIEKAKILTSWQDFLASEWLEIIKSNDAKNKEKWFNNTIRKFALIFLEYTDKLDKAKKIDLVKNLNKHIKNHE